MCGKGGVAQLGEHLLCKQGVIGSIPFTSTISVQNIQAAQATNSRQASSSPGAQAPGQGLDGRILIFKNLVVVDKLFRSWNNDVIASNKSQRKSSE